MAPEQARGEKVDGRADLFSLGVVLYQMSTGVRPFNGINTMSILSSLALDTPSRAERTKREGAGGRLRHRDEAPVEESRRPLPDRPRGGRHAGASGAAVSRVEARCRHARRERRDRRGGRCWPMCGCGGAVLGPLAYWLATRPGSRSAADRGRRSSRPNARRLSRRRRRVAGRSGRSGVGPGALGQVGRRHGQGVRGAATRSRRSSSGRRRADFGGVDRAQFEEIADARPGDSREAAERAHGPGSHRPPGPGNAGGRHVRLPIGGLARHAAICRRSSSARATSPTPLCARSAFSTS